jgi:hypothetical protein
LLPWHRLGCGDVWKAIEFAKVSSAVQCHRCAVKEISNFPPQNGWQSVWIPSFPYHQTRNLNEMNEHDSEIS